MGGESRAKTQRRMAQRFVSVPATESYWLETAGAFEKRPTWAGSGRVDVAVVGGGFTGLSAAFHIKERQPQLRVVVLEAGTIAGGASGRNAGFSMTLFGLELGVTVFRYGKDRAKQADDYMVRAVKYTRELVERLSIDCDYEEHGMMTVATNPNQASRLYKQFTLSQAMGKETTWLDGNEARELVDSPTYIGAWYDPLCALLHPAKLARGMTRAALDVGVEIYEGSPVVRLHPGGRTGSPSGAVSLTLPGGTVRADKVVLATNAFSAALPQLRRVQVPMHTYIVLTEPLTDSQIQSIGWRRRIGVEDGRNFIHYYRLTPDNRLLMGGHDALYYYGNRTDRDHHPHIARRLQQTIFETFPELTGIRFSHHWGGPISVSLDMAPVIGRLGGNVFYSVGCMGHGVSLTQLNGRTLSDLVLDTPSELTQAFFVGRRVTPLPPEPIRFTVVQAIRGAMRLQDAWDNRRAAVRAGRRETARAASGVQSHVYRSEKPGRGGLDV